MHLVIQNSSAALEIHRYEAFMNLKAEIATISLFILVPRKYTKDECGT